MMRYLDTHRHGGSVTENTPTRIQERFQQLHSGRHSCSPQYHAVDNRRRDIHSQVGGTQKGIIIPLKQVTNGVLKKIPFIIVAAASVAAIATDVVSEHRLDAQT